MEINKVRKQKEIDLAGLQAGLKKAQSRINSLEQEVQQKVCFKLFETSMINKRSSVVVIVLACRVGGPGSIPTQCYDSLGK